MEQTTTYVFLAGIGNSGPDHWQRQWYEREAETSVWVEHDSWDNPARDAWVKDLGDALAAVPGPKVLIAHSLGCTLLGEWAREQGGDSGGVTAAFLVAVPDPEGENFPTEAEGFSTAAYGAPLPFPALVVASEDDPYGSLEHAVTAAGRLGSRLANVGHKGHINSSSGLGDWGEGWTLFRDSLV
ncbi:RBBP9/YdeN family alpha/beta hydrolase [Streptomyces sp. NBC_00280]|uniref:RBBP9/YdeN family alpha/beta hydrolase n=1 Tax=Streptomyces sp. NBC_00280 TaxID=2975699 RepID=UPI003243368D